MKRSKSLYPNVHSIAVSEKPLCIIASFKADTGIDEPEEY